MEIQEGPRLSREEARRVLQEVSPLLLEEEMASALAILAPTSTPYDLLEPPKVKDYEPIVAKPPFDLVDFRQSSIIGSVILECIRPDGTYESNHFDRSDLATQLELRGWRKKST